MEIELSQSAFITEIKAKVRQAQYEALKAVNVQLIDLYWQIGKSISEKQSESWGKAIVPTLSAELQKEFPGMSGFSAGNLWLMAQFYDEYNNDSNLVPLVREISWSKHISILKKCKNNLEPIKLMNILRENNSVDSNMRENWAIWYTNESYRKDFGVPFRNYEHAWTRTNIIDWIFKGYYNPKEDIMNIIKNLIIIFILLFIFSCSMLNNSDKNIPEVLKKIYIYCN